MLSPCGANVPAGLLDVSKRLAKAVIVDFGQKAGLLGIAERRRVCLAEIPDLTMSKEKMTSSTAVAKTLSRIKTNNAPIAVS
jgi:hypothetical protein